MKNVLTINHLIIGASDVALSTKFYRDFLEFRAATDDPGASGGQVLETEGCELLLIPFPKERLPNPAHFAFEVASAERFEELLSRAQEMNLAPRSMPPRDSALGPSHFTRGSRSYRIFYVFDPSGVNLEIMVAV